MAHDDLSPDDETAELIEAAERKRGRPVLRDADAGSSGPAKPPSTRKARRGRAMSSDLFVASPEADQPVDHDSALDRKAIKAKRKALPMAEDFEESVGPGLVTRGVHAGLNGAQRTAFSLKRLGPWMIAAAVLAVTLLGLSIYTATCAPAPLPLSDFRVDYLAGPQLAKREIANWLGRFPNRDKLAAAEPWVLDRLTAYLRSLPAVAEVRRVEAVHEPIDKDGQEQLNRILVLELGLRTPEMPAVLSTGERVWIDAEGRVLPGILPAPAVRRPVLMAIERGGAEAVKEALALWKDLEPYLGSDVVEIRLDDPLDAAVATATTQRGIVLYTRTGTRLVWGRPGEDRFGVHRADKVNNLVRIIRVQGDLRRIAIINVRFSQPFYVQRSAFAPAPPAAPVPNRPTGALSNAVDPTAMRQTTSSPDHLLAVSSSLAERAYPL